MSLRCAFYGRFSTDRQNPLSPIDQLAKCQQYAQERGWRVLDDHSYTDEAISGATVHRPGLTRLLEAAESKPRPFDAVLFEDSSRLSRKQADILNLCERFNFAGVKVCFVSQGIDSTDEKFQFLLMARGLVDQLFLSDTANRVRRGMEGLLRRGLHTGGRCFGYRSRKDSDGTRLEVYAPEAAIVRGIFELYAAGKSLKTIARQLNADHVLSPQPQSGRFSRSWCPSSVRVILHNERYLGKLLWSKKPKSRDPKTGRRVFRVIESRKPIHGADAPHLRIISDELWNTVQRQKELVKRVYFEANKRAGLLKSSAMNSPYLFSGLLKCSVCGANLQVISGRGREPKSQRYGCPTNFQRGDSVCTNATRVRRDIVEGALLAGLQEKILRQEVATYVLDRFESELLKELDSMGGEMDRAKKRRAELEIEIQRLTAAIASGIHSPAVMSEITRREQEISAITDRLQSSKPESIRMRIKALRVNVSERLRDLQAVLNNDAVAAKSYLARHVEKIVMEPHGKMYVASGGWNLLGETLGWCRGGELNSLRRPFQGRALPVSYPGTGQ
jgi:site-specific DNA recombinase